MGNYSKDEIAEFKAKDIRISRSGIVQALIQSGVFSKDEIVSGLQVIPIAEMYLRWVWDEKEPVRTEDKKNVEKSVELPCNEGMTDWEGIAEKSNLPIPTQPQIELLHVLFMNYRQISNVEASKLNIAKLLGQIIKKFGKYPSKESSIKIVMESIKLEDLL